MDLRERLEGDTLFIEENIKAVWCYCESGILEMQERDRKRKDGSESGGRKGKG